MKKNNGITLIALIVTIIIMLILVAVTVRILINSGIIGKAKEAKDKTEAAYVEESRAGDSINVNGNTYNSIEEYMTELNKDPDLAKLLEFFGKGRDVIFDDDIEEYRDNIEPIPDFNTSVQFLYSTEGISWITYKNKTYELHMDDEDEVTEVENVSDMAIVIGINLDYVRFTPGDNQTWYEWATDTNSTDDLPIVFRNSQLDTLKGMIIYCHDNNHPEIGRGYPITGGPLNCTLYTVDYTNVKYTDKIQRGTVYFMDSLI